jgi:hypothetical protein
MKAAWRESGTLCPLPILVSASGIVQTASSRSTPDHCVVRMSPDVGADVEITFGQHQWRHDQNKRGAKPINQFVKRGRCFDRVTAQIFGNGNRLSLDVQFRYIPTGRLCLLPVKLGNPRSRIGCGLQAKFRPPLRKRSDFNLRTHLHHPV